MIAIKDTDLLSVQYTPRNLIEYQNNFYKAKYLQLISFRKFNKEYFRLDKNSSGYGIISSTCW